MNLESVIAYLADIPHEEHIVGTSRLFTLGSEGANGKSYSTKIEVSKDDDVGIQCGFVLDSSVNMPHVENLVVRSNYELQQKHGGVMLFVKDMCLIASTGTTGELFDMRELSMRLVTLLTIIAKFDDDLDNLLAQEG